MKRVNSGRAAPIDPAEAVGDGMGDPHLPIVVARPDGWVGDLEDPDAMVCGDSATPEEITAWMAGLAEVERALYEGND